MLVTCTTSAGAATTISGRTLPARSDAFTFTLKEPVGVVAAIALWAFGRRARRWSDMNA